MSGSNWLEVSYGATDFDALMNKFRSAETLPDLPAAALELCDALDKGDADSNRIERIILGDPAITAGVLKAANSALFGGKTNQASTVKGAVLLLGQKAIRSIAVSVWVQSLVHQSKGSPKFSATKFAEHSMFVGFLSKYLLSSAMKTNGVRSKWAPDEVFAAGVLHDLGIGLLASVEPKLYEATVAVGAAYGLSLHHAFERVTGRSLNMLSVAAAQVWKLPDVFIEVLMDFGDPLQASNEQDALCCIAYADYLANVTGRTMCDWRVEEAIDPRIIERVGIEQADVADVLELVDSSTKQFVTAA